MGDERTLADVTEGVRAAIATYTHAMDDGRTDDIVATFCADGFCEMPGLGHHEGHEALRQAYAGWKPVRPQRHLISNTVVTQWDDDEAHATSDFVFLLKGDKGWGIGVVGRYRDVLHRDGAAWRFHSRVAEFTA